MCKGLTKTILKFNKFYFFDLSEKLLKKRSYKMFSCKKRKQERKVHAFKVLSKFSWYNL